MTRDEIIEKLKYELYGIYCYNCRHQNDCENDMCHRKYMGWEPSDELINSIADMAEPEPKWIPCSERLPEESGSYLAWDSDFGESVDTYYKTDSTNKHGCKTFAGWQQGGSRIVAWMPLHEPFRREDGEIWLD